MSRPRDREHDLESLFEGVPELLCIIGSDGRLQGVNSRCVDVLGFRPTDIEGTSVLDYVHPDDREASVTAFARALADTVIIDFTARIRRQDGAYRALAFRARSLDGTAVVATAREASQEHVALASNEALLHDSQVVARVGHYTFDVAGDRWDGSEVLYDILGIGPEYVRDFAGWLNLCHPDDLEMMRHYVVDDVFDKGSLFDMQYRIVRPRDGVTRWMYGHGHLNFDSAGQTVSLFGVIQDITELKEVEQRFRSERDRLNAIMETSEIAIVLVDTTGGILIANRAAEKVLGLPKKEITARTYDALGWRTTAVDGGPFAPEDLPVSLVLTSGKSVTDVRLALEWPDGRRILVSVNASPMFDSEGVMSGVVAVFADITEAVKATDEIRNLNEELEARVLERTSEVESAMQSLAGVNMQLEEASAAKSRLLANMSHELRTPLNSVIGFSTILLQGMAGPLNEEQQRQLEMIRRGGKTLLSLVNDILDLTRVEAGVTSLELSDFNLGETIASLVDSMRPQVEEKGLTLEITASCDGLTMHSDSGKISQILLNLLSNAIKFTNEGSVAVSCEAHGEDVFIRVTDTGIGIPNDQLPLIMNDFHQVDRLEDGMKPQGSGLGLAISWRLAKMLGGELFADSRLGEGSTFTLSVPAKLERRATDR